MNDCSYLKHWALLVVLGIFAVFLLSSEFFSGALFNFQLKEKNKSQHS